MNTQNSQTPPALSLIGAQYFLYFGVMGVFLPYFNLYCYRLGFSGWQIGILSGLRSVVLVIFPLLWGTLADRLGLRRPIYVLCNILSTLIWTAFLFTEDFHRMLAITFFYGMFYAPIISFLEAFAMDVLGSRKKGYGRLRVWGSFSFIAVVLTLGRMLDAVSIRIVLVLILAGSAAMALISFRVPPAKTKPGAPAGPKAAAMIRPQVLFFLGPAFLMLVSHGAYYGFFSIHLENLGYSGSYIGLAWALASGAEMLVMIQSERIFSRFSLENVLTVSFAFAALRWAILYWTGSGALVVISQILHAATYGTFHMASILYIDRLSAPEAKTLGQALNNALTYGLGLMVGFMLNGYLYGRLGSRPLFLISALIALGAGCLFWCGQLALGGGNDRGRGSKHRISNEN